MKRCLIFPFLLCFFGAAAQRGEGDWAGIDAFVQQVSDSRPDSLAAKLTRPFPTELQKTRAIYSWITQNIGYTTGLYSIARRRGQYKAPDDPTDTMTVWKSGDEMMAIRVLHRRNTVCEGYARLFKVLCHYAGLQAEVVFGYARSNIGSRRFRSNHAWNAVLIDSTWHLLDATWASGYFNFRDEFVQQRNDQYFLTPPEDFIQDHYPEDLRWALLPQVPLYRELQRAPLQYRAYDKYGIATEGLGSGVIETFVGDTLTLELHSKDAAKDQRISANSGFDSALMAQSPASVFLQPRMGGNKITYRYVVQGADIQWLHLIYNEDPILRYRLRVKQREPLAALPPTAQVH